MSTAAASAVTDQSPKPKHEIKLTRGAAYLLEGVVQRQEPFSTPHKITTASKLWSRLRKENKAEADGYKFEKGIIREEGETDLAFAKRQIALNDSFEAWRDAEVVLQLSDKLRDIALEAIKWGVKNRDKGAFPANNSHMLSLLEGFGLADDDSE